MTPPQRVRPTGSHRRERAATTAARATGRGRALVRGRSRGHHDMSPSLSADLPVPSRTGSSVVSSAVHVEIPAASTSSLPSTEGDVDAGDVDAGDVDAVDPPSDGGNLGDRIGGGPEDESILTSFRGHVAHALWDNREARGLLKCYNHTHRLSKWRLNRTDGKTNARFRQLVEDSGLYSLLSCSYRWTNVRLVTAFVERWHLETNTFHLPFGEMSISLDDVHTLLGLSVTGKPVTCPEYTMEEAIQLLGRTLGIDAQKSKLLLSEVRGQSVRLTTLVNDFEDVSDDDSPERIAQCARAYMLYILGCTIFSDRSGSRISIMFLHILQDLSRVGEYAWGAAALAFLYWQLGTASRLGTTSIGGYLTLLESWIYEHFQSVFPSTHNKDYLSEQPCSLRWVPKDVGHKLHDLYEARERLDDMLPQQVVWNPYASIRTQHSFPDVACYKGCLKAGDIIEPYQPDRILRQFGWVQSIPRVTTMPIRAQRRTGSQVYQTLSNLVDGQWIDWENHVISISQRNPVHFTHESADDYMPWFTRVSHTRIVDPGRRHPATAPVTAPLSTHVDALERLQRIATIGSSALTMENASSLCNPDLVRRLISQIVNVAQGMPSTCPEGSSGGSNLYYHRTRRHRPTDEDWPRHDP